MVFKIFRINFFGTSLHSVLFYMQTFSNLFIKRQMSVMLIAQPTSFVFLRWKSVIRPVTRGMPAGVLHHLRIWLHALGVHKMSKTNTLIRSELHADGITKPIQDKQHSCYCVRAQVADDRHVIVTHVKILIPL